MANFDLNNDDFVHGANKRAKLNESKTSDHQVMLNVRVPKRLRDRLKLAAVHHDQTHASIVEEALEDWFKKSENRPKNITSAFDDDGL